MYERQIEKLDTSSKSPAQPCFKDEENKIVTFDIEENESQETPLMFSRSSSLDSLSGFDQHSIQDDRSSIISDFSHRTSGAVSPSELPDSPTQTIPPSPHQLKHQNYPNKVLHSQHSSIFRYYFAISNLLQIILVFKLFAFYIFQLQACSWSTATKRK